MIKKKNNNFSDEELKIYMAVPAEKKLQHLRDVNNLLKKIRPLASQKIAKRLHKEGF